MAIELRDHPELAAELEVIDTRGPSTIQSVVAALGLDGAGKAGADRVLLELANDPMEAAGFAPGFIDGFVPVSGAVYDDIRVMLQAAESARFITLR